MSAELIAELQTWIKGIKSTVAQYPSYAHAESGYDNAQMRKIADVMERASQRLAAAQQDESRWAQVADGFATLGASYRARSEREQFDEKYRTRCMADVYEYCAEKVRATIRPSAPDRPQEVEKP